MGVGGTAVGVIVGGGLVSVAVAVGGAAVEVLVGVGVAVAVRVGVAVGVGGPAVGVAVGGALVGTGVTVGGAGVLVDVGVGVGVLVGVGVWDGVGAVLTVVAKEPELLDRLKSNSLAMTPTTFMIVPGALDRATTVTEAPTPDARVPMTQETVPPLSAQPTVEPALTNATPLGNTSVTVTDVADDGPPLKTAIE